MEWNRHWVARLDGRKMASAQDRLNRRITGSGEVAEGVALFNAAHSVQELLASAGVELHELGREWHTVNGCPLPGCTSTHDAFRVHIDRKAGDTRGPQWACRRCGRGGDALRLAMLLAGADPVERGATARFLRERGFLADTCGQWVPDSRAGTGIANNGLEMGSKHTARTRDFAQDRSGHVKAENMPSRERNRPHAPLTIEPVGSGQVSRAPASLIHRGHTVSDTVEGTGGAPVQTREGQAVPAVSHQGPAPVGGRGEPRPVPAPARAGRGELAPADPLRWSRPDVLAAFGRHPTPDEIEALDERAGIIEFDAALTRQDAEAAALREASNLKDR